MIPGAGIPGRDPIAGTSPSLVSGDANASGFVLTAIASVIDGTATADALALGTTLGIDASIIAGVASVAASGDGLASGVILTADLTLAAGIASGDAVLPGALLAIDTELIAGNAIGLSEADALANGVMLSISTSLIPGMASASITPEQPRRSIGGTAHEWRRPKDGYAHGALITARVSKRLLKLIAEMADSMTWGHFLASEFDKEDIALLTDLGITPETFSSIEFTYEDEDA